MELWLHSTMVQNTFSHRTKPWWMRVLCWYLSFNSFFAEERRSPDNQLLLYSHCCFALAAIFSYEAGSLFSLSELLSNVEIFCSTQHRVWAGLSSSIFLISAFRFTFSNYHSGFLLRVRLSLNIDELLFRCIMLGKSWWKTFLFGRSSILRSIVQ